MKVTLYTRHEIIRLLGAESLVGLTPKTTKINIVHDDVDRCPGPIFVSALILPCNPRNRRESRPTCLRLLVVVISAPSISGNFPMAERCNDQLLSSFVDDHRCTHNKHLLTFSCTGEDSVVGQDNRVQNGYHAARLCPDLSPRVPPRPSTSSNVAHRSELCVRHTSRGRKQIANMPGCMIDRQTTIITNEPCCTETLFLRAVAVTAAA